MTQSLSLEEYGHVLRTAFATLHGGYPNEPAEPESVLPEESVAAFIARTRAQTLESLLAQVAAVQPPVELQAVHDALVHLLEAATEADKALEEQIDAYNRGIRRLAFARPSGWAPWWLQAPAWTAISSSLFGLPKAPGAGLWQPSA